MLCSRVPICIEVSSVFLTIVNVAFVKITSVFCYTVILQLLGDSLRSIQEDPFLLQTFPVPLCFFQKSHVSLMFSHSSNQFLKYFVWRLPLCFATQSFLSALVTIFLQAFTVLLSTVVAVLWRLPPCSAPEYYP